MEKYNNNNNNNTAEAAIASAQRAATNKIKKYDICHTFFFTNRLQSYSGAWSIEGIEFDANLCSKMSKITGDLL